MISKGPALYRLNLIREIREREKKIEKQRNLTAIISLVCFGFFILSLIYSGFTILTMEGVLSTEQLKLDRLKVEYNKYKTATLIVDKSDLELLNELQGKGVMWTRKLAAIAKHLPENYWITRFSFINNELHVSGFGYISSHQEQLLVLDDYIKRLKKDTSFTDTFKNIQLNLAQRSEDASGPKVAFDFTASVSRER